MNKFFDKLIGIIEELDFESDHIYAVAVSLYIVGEYKTVSCVSIVNGKPGKTVISRLTVTDLCQRAQQSANDVARSQTDFQALHGIGWTEKRSKGKFVVTVAVYGLDQIEARYNCYQVFTKADLF